MAEDTPQQEEIIDPIRLFTPRVQSVVEGLAYLGHINETVTLAGHRFGLQTLRPEHRYAIATIVQPYRNTLMEVEAWNNAHVAVALTHVDGNPNFCDSIGPSLEDFVRGRFNYISNAETGWYKSTLDYLFVQYTLLELKADQAVKQLNFLSQKTATKPALLADLEDILNESEPSSAGINGDIPLSPHFSAS